MTNSIFLTIGELREWTDLVRPSAIRRWLDQHGYRYEISAKGWPKVLRSTLLDKQTSGLQRKEPQLRLS